MVEWIQQSSLAPLTTGALTHDPSGSANASGRKLTGHSIFCELAVTVSVRQVGLLSQLN